MKAQLFLNALKNIDFGNVKITLPDGRVENFKGSRPGPDADWAVNDWGVFDDFVARGEMGFADAYIEGRWQSSDLAALTHFGLVNADQLEQFFYGHKFYAIWIKLKSFLLRNSIHRSRKNVVAHYDLGNAFYKLWLDASMTYSCGLFEGDATKTLEQAQKAKYGRILDRLGAKPGSHILEIGCGWGGFAEEAALRGLQVTGVTLADTQAEFARQRLKDKNLDHLVSIELIDYRNVQGHYDYIVSIGMFEHVGEAFWLPYFKVIAERLRKGGKAMVQTITLDDEVFERLHDKRGFIEEYIFPGGMLPSKRRFKTAASNAALKCEDLYAFGGDYAITLRKWLSNFESKLSDIRALGYDEKFIRLWRLYLTSCIASFESLRSDVMQVELQHA